MSDFLNLKPGTPEAVQKGCQCERNQPGPTYRCNGNCPIHGMGELLADFLGRGNEPRPKEAKP